MHYIALRKRSDCFFYLSDISNEERQSKSFSLTIIPSHDFVTRILRMLHSDRLGRFSRVQNKNEISNRISKTVIPLAV